MLDKNTVLALIPARAGSKGVPNKNIRPLAGQPLLAYSCQCGLGSRLVDRTLVSTDSWQFAAVVKSYGAEAPFLRPDELAGDDSPTVDTIRHALDWLADHDGWNPDVVVLLQPTSPLRTSEDVDQALDLLTTSGADSVISVCPVPAHHHPQWQFRIENDRLQPYGGLSMSELPTRRQALATTFTRNGAIYAFRRTTFEQTGSIYGERCAPLVMPVVRSVNIDSLADWHAAETYLKSAEALREAS